MAREMMAFSPIAHTIHKFIHIGKGLHGEELEYMSSSRSTVFRIYIH